ncbi:MAG: Type II secretion system protein G [Candidatus Woesebacteria bacterium GW2011_GWA1_33_30]|uniref:Type II secretion system protein G n=1 Tax=Candidatus Woesebacteria bacterium GW2011_GWA2_33_28 TaxID=1618561 RepID=A0A0G0CAK4_9BACT|nr:MAG: Type II secretion system protein G [Candidatus Woesebacteria bacterium GW2011_GWA2_33_28]KKP48973.1 MAG: Type II secretion system protein G [Candidatus Woesebacteria bacterium GW2011_GWA1_33_30]KKP49920.1 MAG: Type II secretion system protein G [Microgenomates group bacterium GW2011_GWC1_33_32]KKP52564.1 MAG: Type II secretion system protein G [Candidatus Woesebacteria bacterium GW2011_GWB1_33_38]KKP56502.1 MAG: Type II secretion system protein G [Microgenomates group bacterium GW2011_G
MIRKLKKIIKGFTLVEILVILVIIGSASIFSVIQIPVQLQKAKDAVRKSNLDSMKKAIDEFYQDSNCYPQTIPACKNALVLGSLVIKDNLPCDPKTSLSYTYVPEISECPKWFQLYANLEYTNDRIIDKIGCRFGCGPNCQFNYGVASPNQNLNPFCEAETLSDPISSLESSPTPIPEQLQYVCSPSGNCEIYANPELSGCPDVYLNDSLCQRACSERENRCHDARGKLN